MSKIIVLAEKPSVGRDLARVLGCAKKNNGYIEGSKYIVTWALGHLVTLADPEAYDKKYKAWNMEDLPMLPKYMKLITIKKTYKQFSVIKGLLNRKDVDKIIIATDAGREGELVARWIIEKAGVKKDIERLWISSQTDKAIKDGFKNLKPGKAYENLYKAAIARAEADWLVGLNVTRALTCKYNAQLSAGRVQTPTLAMIVQREEEIKKFVPKAYYKVQAKTEKFSMYWNKSGGQVSTFDKNEADKIQSKIKGRTSEVVDVVKKNKKNYAPALYDLTELQRDANKIYGYSAKETLSIMQKLYEQHKVLTYPRTDSRYITTDMIDTLPQRLKAVSFGAYTRFTKEILNKKINNTKAFVNNSKVSDHHAIIPTEQSPSLSKLSNDELKIYELVIKRFISVMMPAFEFEQTTIKAKVENIEFVAKGKVVKAMGWKAIYDRNIEERDEDENEQNYLKDQMLPKLSIGDKLKIQSSSLKEGKTSPPARFNEATLLSAMENPHKFIHVSKEHARTLGETGGLGTVATRADIIEKLFNSFVIEKKGKEIYPTSKGIQLIELVPGDLKSPLMTANWENKLGLISKGKLPHKKFITEMRSYSEKLVNDVKRETAKYTHDNMTRAKCPECGKYLLEVNGKKGKMLVCQDRECGYRKGIARVTNARCPECHKKLELRGKGDGQIFVCPNCSYREKLSAFQKRRSEGNSKVTKRDVNKYLKKQKQEAEEPMNSAFADALSKLKLK